MKVRLVNAPAGSSQLEWDEKHSAGDSLIVPRADGHRIFLDTYQRSGSDGTNWLYRYVSSEDASERLEMANQAYRAARTNVREHPMGIREPRPQFDPGARVYVTEAAEYLAKLADQPHDCIGKYCELHLIAQNLESARRWLWPTVAELEAK